MAQELTELLRRARVIHESEACYCFRVALKYLTLGDYERASQFRRFGLIAFGLDYD